MVVCSVCGVNCRGSCKRCGVRLCHKHMPASARAKCPMCPSVPRARSPASVTTPYYIPSHAPSKPLEDMDRDEALAYTTNLRQRLEAKQRRERVYLDRRASRGTHTPTDDAYEADQLLEGELLAILDHIISGI